MISLKYAPDAFKLLNGVFCIYKPAGCSIPAVRHSITINLCRDLNELTPRELSDIVSLEGSVCSKKPFEVLLSPNSAHHKLVSGPHYQPQDIRLMWVSPVGSKSSGVVLMAINDSCKLLNKGFGQSFLRKYVIKGVFGFASDNFFSSGKVIERSSFSHVKESSLGKVLASTVASHQSRIYDDMGSDIQSQAAYDIASKGLLNTYPKSKPIVLNIKCIHFKLPYFTLELQCINETEEYLGELIHDIGIDLKTNAVCKELRRVQFGHFTVTQALLRKHWSLAHVLNNLELCNTMLSSPIKHAASHDNFHLSTELKQKDSI